MFLTVALLGTFLGLNLLHFAGSVFTLRLGLRWVGARHATLRRVALVTAGVFAINIALSCAAYLLPPVSETTSVVLGLLFIVAMLATPVAVVTQAFRVSLWQAFKIELLLLAWMLALIAVVLLLVRPFVFEPFMCPANSMAPTLLGPHLRDTCPICGALCHGTSDDRPRRPNESPRMICEAFHVSRIPQVSPRLHTQDRFAVAKFLTPRRWDLLVFRSAEDVITVKRVVGLPGETIVIDEGAVFADDIRLSLPESLTTIEYNPPDDLPPSALQWGTKDYPATLSADEYFVLGDFSAQSYDSRFWQQSVPGHPPYAVPRDRTVGVVSHIYWPLSRWRVLR